jgi:hypothetical protein
MCRRSSLLKREVGTGQVLGEEPNHMTTRKPGPLLMCDQEKKFHLQVTCDLPRRHEVLYLGSQESY